MTATRGQGGRGGYGSPVSSDSPIVPSSGPPTYEPSHVVQSLIEIQKDISALSTKTNRLISDVSDLDEHVDALRHKLSRAEGFGIAAVVLVPACAALVWWLVGGQLTEIRNKMYAGPPAASSSLTAPTAANNPSTDGKSAK